MKKRVRLILFLIVFVFAAGALAARASSNWPAAYGEGQILSSAEMTARLNDLDERLRALDGMVAGARSRATHHWTSNLSLEMPGDTTLMIRGANDTDLSEANPGYVTVPGLTNGRLRTLEVVANVSITQSALDGNLFGVAAGYPWNDELPVFVYAVNTNDLSAGLIFMISRDPRASVSPAATLIGQPGSSVCDTQECLFSMTSGINLEAAANKPCVAIGSLQMRKPQAADQWTFNASGELGIGRYQDRIIFKMPPGQGGAAQGRAATGKHFTESGGGTAPSWSNEQVTYSIQSNGFVDLHIKMNGALNPGMAPGSLRLPLPYAVGSTDRSFGTGFFKQHVLGNPNPLPMTVMIEAPGQATLYRVNAGFECNAFPCNYGSLPELNARGPGDFASPGDELEATVRFRAFP